MAGLTPQGFVKKTLDEIKKEREDEVKDVFGKFVNVLPGTVFSQIIGIPAEREAAIWDAIEATHQSQYTDTAEDVSLDGAVSLLGIKRIAARKSLQKNELLFGDAGTFVDAGVVYSVSGNPTAKFKTLNSTTLVAGLNAIQSIVFGATPDAGYFTLTYRGLTTAHIAFGASASAVASALNALANLSGVTVTGTIAAGLFVTFAGNDGLQAQPVLASTSALTLSSDPVTITHATTQTGIPQGKVDCVALVEGPVDAPIGTLTVIDTPVSGLTRVINTEATTLGRLRETDAELKARADSSQAIRGNSTLDAIVAKLRNVSGVRNVLAFENDEEEIVDGRPPNSYEMVVDGGADQDLWDTLWASKPAGMQMVGSEVGSVTDTTDTVRTLRFSRPSPVRIYTCLDLEVDEDFPANGAALAKEAILSWGNSLGIGTTLVVYPRMVAQLDFIPGILNIIVRVDIAPVSTTPEDPAVDDNILFDPFEVASLAADDTEINIL